MRVELLSCLLLHDYLTFIPFQVDLSMNLPLKVWFHLREDFQDSFLYSTEMFEIVLQSFVFYSLHSIGTWNV